MAGFGSLDKNHSPKDRSSFAKVMWTQFRLRPCGEDEGSWLFKCSHLVSLYTPLLLLVEFPRKKTAFYNNSCTCSVSKTKWKLKGSTFSACPLLESSLYAFAVCLIRLKWRPVIFITSVPMYSELLEYFTKFLLLGWCTGKILGHEIYRLGNGWMPVL